MALRIQMQLANPALIFIYSLVLLQFGCEIGMHWSNTPGIAVWIAVCAARIMVIHNLVAGFIWMEITVKWTQAVRKKAEQKSEGLLS
jgi:protein-S-isoprenylcysteine O-methyltransferase Ste14